MTTNIYTYAPNPYNTITNSTITASSTASVSMVKSAPLNINQGTDAEVSFTADGKIATVINSTDIKEMIDVINLMKRFMIDVASDPEISERYPYIKEAAFDWVVNGLKR